MKSRTKRRVTEPILKSLKKLGNERQVEPTKIAAEIIHRQSYNTSKRTSEVAKSLMDDSTNRETVPLHFATYVNLKPKFNKFLLYGFFRVNIP